MKKLISVLIAAAMSVSLASCAPGSDVYIQRYDTNSHIRFSWWSNDIRSSYTIQALKKFEKQNDVSVDPVFCEFSGYKLRLETDVNAKEVPDVLQMNYNWLYEYYSHDPGLFYDMNKLKDKIRLSNFSQQQLELGTINGKLVGIPTSLNGIDMFYNTQTLKRYSITQPSSWVDLIEAGKRLKPHGVYAMEMGEASMWLCCAAYAEQITDKPMFDSSNRLQYTADDFGIMLDFYKKLIENNVSPRPSNFNHMDFYNDKAAGIACWISESKSFFSSNTGVNAAAVNISIGELPGITEPAQSGWYKKPMSFYCISAKTRDVSKSAELVDFLLNSEDMAELQGTEKGIPLSKSAQEVLEARDMLSDLQAVADKKMNENKNIKLMSPYLENEQLMKAFFSAGDDVLYNNADLNQMAAQILSTARNITEIPK